MEIEKALPNDSCKSCHNILLDGSHDLELCFSKCNDYRRQIVKSWFQPYFDKLYRVLPLKFIAEQVFDKLPDYWFIKPASSSGKFHPKFANIEGGLALHSLAAVKVWDFLHKGFIQELVDELPDSYPVYEIGLIAVIFHDAIKYGDPKLNLYHTTKTHDVDSAVWFVETAKQCLADAPDFYVSDEILALIYKCIDRHMGPWSTNGPPTTLLERLVFISDFVASSKYHEEAIFNVEK